jgi:hypothetical protein
MRWMKSAAATAAILASTGPLTACASDALGPSGTTTFTTTTALSLSQFDSALGSGPTRLEVKLFPGGLEAREIEVEPDDAEEKIVSQVKAIDPASATITLELGDLVVSYASGTRFRTPNDSRVSRSEWEAQIAGALSGGSKPLIEARRNPPASPQAPADPSFTAGDLRLASGVNEPQIEFYVDGDNFETVGTPPPNAILRVLNLAITITDNTELRLRSPGGGVPAGTVEFEAGVTAVDVAAGKLILAGGTVIRVGNVTFDPLGELFSLQATADAVSSGKAVRAEGRGTVTSAGPPVAIDATAIKVEIDD